MLLLGQLFFAADAKSNSRIPVSYTHLDTHGMETHFFGLHEQEVYGTKIVGSVDHVEATLHTPQWEKRVCIPIPGEHNVYNALAATVAGMLLDLSEQEIVSGIEHVTTISGRNHFIEANGMVVIDDCYNANPMSMRASSEVLGHAKGRKVACLLYTSTR